MTQNLSIRELRFLSSSQEFQQIIAADPELDRLESLRYDPACGNLALLENLNVRTRIGRLETGPVTPACWLMLRLCRSPYVYGGDVTVQDIDLFLFLLVNGAAHHPSELPRICGNMIRKTGLSPEAVHELLMQRVRTAFLPLTLLPSAASAGFHENPAETFDADWLNRICSTAAVRTHTALHDVIHHTSLNCVCWQYVNELRERDFSHEIRCRPDAETAERIMERTYELGREYLTHHAVS